MTSHPRISHLIATYQQAAFIEETLTSALEQDYDSLEVVVADDGSTDGTAEVVRAFAARHPTRLVALTGGPNLGVTANCNRGLAQCRGEFVSFQGGDDVLLPGKLAAQAAHLDARPEVTLVGHAVEEFHDDPAPNQASSWILHPPRREGAVRDVIRDGPPFNGVAVMVRRASIPTYGFDARLPLTSDWKLWIDCLATGGRFAMVDGILARYRILASSVSRARRSQHEIDKHITLAIVESQYPQYAADCRHSRARLLLRQGEEALGQSDYSAARQFFQASLAESHFNARAYSRLALTALPQRLRDSARTAFRSVRPTARNHHDNGNP